MSYRDRPDGYNTLKWAESDLQRRRRRPATKWLLLLGIAIIVVWAIIVVLPGGDAHGFPNVALYMPMIIAGSMSPFARAPWLTRKGRARYDEFERAAYARATAIAYAAFLTLVTAVFLWLAIAAAKDLPHPHDKNGWIAWGVSLVLIGAALPLLFAEFTVPYPPVTEEFDA